MRFFFQDDDIVKATRSEWKAPIQSVNEITGLTEGDGCRGSSRKKAKRGRVGTSDRELERRMDEAAETTRAERLRA